MGYGANSGTSRILHRSQRKRQSFMLDSKRGEKAAQHVKCRRRVISSQSPSLATGKRSSRALARARVLAAAARGNADNRSPYSGGNDSVVFAHDLEYASATQSSSHRDGGIRPTQVWLDHESAVNSISPHPFNPALFISASSDGTLRQFDLRSHDSDRAVAIIADEHGMNHVQHHPLTPEVFVYAGERGDLALIDGRTGWRSSNGDGLEDFNVASRVAVHMVRSTQSNTLSNRNER